MNMISRSTRRMPFALRACPTSETRDFIHRTNVNREARFLSDAGELQPRSCRSARPLWRDRSARDRVRGGEDHPNGRTLFPRPSFERLAQLAVRRLLARRAGRFRLLARPRRLARRDRGGEHESRYESPSRDLHRRTLLAEAAVRLVLA